ncbi:ribonuclease T1 [Mycobacterium sp. MAA66]|uniref:ribonuclease domain-containing protein n=1 Tax=Mycobacterium sp. MAA66 TaxID=3156297 RepID=UPI003518FAB1
MSRITVRTAAVIAGGACLLMLAPACAKNAPAHLTGSPSTASSSSASHSGLNNCQISALPAAAGTTVRLIHSGGPFPYPRDGIVFGNFEHRLPNQSRGYYHEYTVPTPGAKTRGTRRVITGGQPLTDPPEFYYTGDHYETFCQIGGA